MDLEALNETDSCSGEEPKESTYSCTASSEIMDRSAICSAAHIHSRSVRTTSRVHASGMPSTTKR